MDQTSFLNQCKQNHLKEIKDALDQGFDPNFSFTLASGGCTMTPLMYSILCEKYDIAIMLIPKVKDINERDSNGDTALLYAIEFGPKLAHQQLKLITLCLRYGADVRIKTSSGVSAMSAAVLLQNARFLLPVLVIHGGDINDSFEELEGFEFEHLELIEPYQHLLNENNKKKWNQKRLPYLLRDNKK